MDTTKTPTPVVTQMKFKIAHGQTVTIEQKGEERWEASTGYMHRGTGKTPRAALAALLGIHKAFVKDIEAALGAMPKDEPQGDQG